MEAIGSGAKTSDSLRLRETKSHRLYFTPFSYANTDAKLVVLGITPGPNQLELAIHAVQHWKAHPSETVLREAKKHASFG